MDEDYYFKNIDVPKDVLSMAYWVFILIIGGLSVILPQFGLYLGIIAMVFAVIKLIGLSKDYFHILLLFIFGMFLVIFSGFAVGEWIIGGLMILYGLLGIIQDHSF